MPSMGLGTTLQCGTLRARNSIGSGGIETRSPAHDRTVPGSSLGRPTVNPLILRRQVGPSPTHIDGVDSFREITRRYTRHGLRHSKHDDPKQSVVDADCRLHWNANSFVAGSSVFPTYGTANSALTILALAFRRSDHLRVLRS